MIPSCKHFKLIDDKGTRKIYGMTIKKGVTVNLSWNSNWPECPACIIEQREKDIADLIKRMRDELFTFNSTLGFKSDTLEQADAWLKEHEHGK